MRLPNFLSTVSNRASLSITQTLYDRRALDCTSNMPLVQSLQRLMVLTSSSSRVRETLCHDGGLERLIQIMKEAHRPNDVLASYKWHLCMQCLLNLGARGSEGVRMRVLEAGAIPVIATILDNYLVAHGDSLEHRDRDREDRHRRVRTTAGSSSSMRTQSTAAPSLVTSNSDPQTSNMPDPFPAPAAQPLESDAEELREDGNNTQDDNEPRMAAQAEQFLNQFSQATGRVMRSRRSQFEESNSAAAMSGATDPASTTQNRGVTMGAMEVEQGGMAQFINGLLIPREQDVFWALEIIAFVSKYSHLRREMQETHFLPQLSLRPHEELFSGMSLHDNTTSGEDEMEYYDYDEDHSPHDCDHHHQHEQGHDDVSSGHDDNDNTDEHRREMMQNITDEFMEIDEPSRSDLQQDPALNEALASQKQSGTQPLPPNLDDIERAYYTYDFENNVDFDDEYLTRPINLFELVERFTAFRSPREFPHWACIIMRNFVRKDEGGIRQCANFACGKWEEFPRQFAKCRRCKRTKYCSKACQLKAWSMHRYWCAPSSSSSQPSASQTSSQASSAQPSMTQPRAAQQPSASQASAQTQLPQVAQLEDQQINQLDPQAQFVPIPPPFQLQTQPQAQPLQMDMGQPQFREQETFPQREALQRDANMDSDLESRVDSPQPGNVTFAS